MKKYFVISDLHSFYNELIEGLSNASFDKDNDNHILIVLGDVFDRGEGTIDIYNYLTSLNQNRLILIKGNHEYLYLELLKKGFPEDHDFSNGTVATFCHIAQLNPNCSFVNNETPKELERHMFQQNYGLIYENDVDSLSLWKQIKSAVAKSKITSWIKSSKWIDYFELDNYIFVHSFIPTKLKETHDYYKNAPFYTIQEDWKEYDPDWRNGDWEEACWGCPWHKYLLGCFDSEIKEDKTLVCGHWHTSDFFLHIDGININTSEIYYGDHIIAIDGGVTILREENEKWHYVHKQNVLVIESNY